MSNIIVSKLGAKLIDCERIGNKLLEPNKPAYFQLTATVTEDLVESNRKINLKKLKELRLTDEAVRHQVHQIIAPATTKEVLKQLFTTFWNGKHNFAIVENPFLFDNFLQYWVCFPTVFVHTTDTRLWLSRIKEKEKCTPQEADRIARLNDYFEMPQKFAEMVVENNGDKTELGSTFGQKFIPFVEL